MVTKSDDTILTAYSTFKSNLTFDFGCITKFLSSTKLPRKN